MACALVLAGSVGLLQGIAGEKAPKEAQFPQGTNRPAPVVTAIRTLEDVSSPQRKALLIGINRYEQEIVPPTPMSKDTSLPIEMLKPFPYRRWFAERDMEVLAEELRRHGYEVRMLLGSSLGEERATRQNIDAAVRKLQEDRRPGELVLVAFAGYARQVQWRDSQGIVLKNEAGKERHDVLLAPLDVSSRKAQTYLSLTELVKRLNPSSSQETLFLIDGCRDATPAGQPGSLTGKELEGELPEGTALLFGSTSPDPSRERRYGDSGGGVFFERCVDALRGEVANSSGAVNWDDFLATFRRHLDSLGKNERSLGVWCPDAHAPVAHHGHMQNAVEVHHLSSSPLLVPPQSVIESKKFGPHECVLIPGGSFEMGAALEDQDADADEYPRHQVNVKPFYMSQHEVTVEQFNAYATEARDKFLDEQLAHDVRNDRGNHPVIHVGPHDAKQYCVWLSRKIGKKVRLPTEAEWEFAARAGSQSVYIHGIDAEGLIEYGNVSIPPEAIYKRYRAVKERHEWKATAPVGRFRPNRFGLYDMTGNVAEWCAGEYTGYIPQHDGLTFICQANEGDYAAVFRGGSWKSSANDSRVSDRTASHSSNDYEDVGFRIVVEVARKPKRK
ncbi:MAG: SUMF1/EgtB/PvdO family nonheme iron enzyme [Planctomycetaceae bacterium]